MIKKHIYIFFLIILFIGLFLPSCKKEDSTHFDLDAMKKIIQEKNDRFTNAHVTGDNMAIDTLFTIDAKSFPPNAAPVIGRSAIATLTAKYIEYGVSEFKEEIVELYGCEDLLNDQGNYTMTYGKDNTVENGKYLNVWKYVNGEWKIYMNMWNTNQIAK